MGNPFPVDFGGLQNTLVNLNQLLAAIQQTLASFIDAFASIRDGATPAHYQSAATTNATSVAVGATQLRDLNIENLTGTIYYLKLYDKATAPTVGTDLPVQTFALRANDRTAPLLPAGLKFTAGLAFALTAGAPNADNTAVVVGIHVNLGYTQ